MEPKTLSQQITVSSRLQVKESIVVLAFTAALPLLVHLIPFGGNVPLGARLLPIFYAPLIAVIFFRWHVGLVAALFAPVINHLLTGMPELAVVAILSFELVLFAGFVYFFKDLKGIRWISAPLAYLLAKMCSVAALIFLSSLLTKGTPLDFGINSIINGIAGIAILTCLNVIALRIKYRLNSKTNDGKKSR